VAVSLRLLLERRRGLEERRARALAVILEEARGAGDQLARKSVEEVLRLAEAARWEARRSYRLDPAARRMRLLLRG